MKNKYSFGMYFDISLSEELTRALDRMPTHKISDLKSLITAERLDSSLDFTTKVAGEAASALNAIRNNIQDNHVKVEDLHNKFLKNLSKNLNEIIQAYIINKRERINSIVENSDRVTKLIILNTTYSTRMKPNEPFQLITGNFLSTANLKEELRQRLLRLDIEGTERAEAFHIKYLSIFENNDFIEYVRKRPNKKTILKHIECTNKSITELDYFRIHTELVYIENPLKRDQSYEEITNSFKTYEQKLKTIRNILKKTTNTAYAELKEYISNNNLSINQATAAEILLNPAKHHMFKEIIKIDKKLSQRKTRSSDTQKQLNFPVYYLYGTKNNPCDLIKDKTKTIKILVENFFSDEHLGKNTEIIKAKKNIEYQQSNRQITVRMPKPMISKIHSNARKHNISIKMLLNIIIQHHLKDTTPSENSSPKEQPVAVDTEVNQPPSQPKKKFNFHSNTPAPKKRKVSTRF